MSQPFANVVGNEAQLRELYRRPATTTQLKVQPRLDKHARAFIDASPFVLVGTTSPDGTAAASPKGGRPGFFMPLADDNIPAPDLPGTTLLDSSPNIVTGPATGRPFLAPGLAL